MSKPPGIKYAALTGILAMLISCIWVAVEYKTHLFADTSFAAFEIINQDKFCFYNQRYGSFLPQVVLLLGTKLHLPLSWLLISYVTSVEVIYLCIMVLLTLRFRQYALAVLMCLYYFLFVSDSYFMHNADINQAVAWMFLMYGAAIHTGVRSKPFFISLAVFIVFAALALSTHFVVIIPTIFMLVLVAIENDHWPFNLKQTIGFGVVLVILIVIKMLTAGSSGGYEQDHLYNLTHISFRDVFISFSRPVVSAFLVRCGTVYLTGSLVFLAGVAVLIIRRQYAVLWWVLAGLTGYLALMGIIYASDDDGKILRFHIELEWVCLSIVAAAPFVFGLLPRIKPVYAVLLMLVIVGWRISYIAMYSAPQFQWRVNYTKNVLAQMRQKNLYKLGLYEDASFQTADILSWTNAQESAFESIAEGDRPLRTFFTVDSSVKNLGAIATDPKYIYLIDPVPYRSINNKYFAIDTIKSYLLIKAADFLRQ